MSIKVNIYLNNTVNKSSMTYKQLIFPCFFGILIYSILTMSVGPKGIIPMKKLVQQSETISENVQDLLSIRDELQDELANISGNPDTIAVYAHELGYISDGEYLMKLAGFTKGIKRDYIAGNALQSSTPFFIPEWINKLVGILIFFCILILERIIQKKAKKKLLSMPFNI